MSRSKKAFVIIAMMLVLVLTCGHTFYQTARTSIDYIYPSLANSVALLSQKLERDQHIITRLEAYNAFFDETFCRTAAEMIDNSRDIRETLDHITDGQENVSLYFVGEDGTIIKNRNAEESSLTKEQWDELIQNGHIVVRKDGIPATYACAKCKSGFVAAKYPPRFDSEIDSALQGMSRDCDYFLADAASGEIISASDEALIGCSYGEPEEIFLDLDREARSKKEMEKNGVISIAGKQYYVVSIQFGSYIIAAFSPVIDLLYAAIEMTIISVVVVAAFFAVIVIYLFSLRSRREPAPEDRFYLPGKKRRCIDRYALTHVTALILFAALLLSFADGYMSGLACFSYQYEMSGKNLELLTENLDANRADEATFRQSMASVLRGMGNVVTDLLCNDPEFRSHERLVEFAEYYSLEEVSVYNAKGMLEATSGEYPGYELSQNPEDTVYTSRSLLTSDKVALFTEYGDGSGRYLHAQRRKDAPGLICLVYRNDDFRALMQLYSDEEAIRNTDFGNATAFFVKITDSEALYMVEPYSNSITNLGVRIPQELDKDRFSGIIDIDGTDYYVNTRRNDRINVICALECERISRSSLKSWWALPASFALALLICIFGCGCAPCAGDEGSASEHGADRQTQPERGRLRIDFQELADKRFRTMMKIILIITALSFIYMVFIPDGDGVSMWHCMVFGEWNKGLNIFAVTVSIIFSSFVYLITVVLKHIISFIGKNSGTRGATISNLIMSITHFASIFLIIGCVLYEIGIDSNALLASAGIVSLVIGIAARSIFEDLLAGLFLMLDGKIHVGDWVGIGDFKGEIVEIGARLSIVQKGSSRLVINNSDFKRFYRLSDAPAVAWVEITVGPNEDIDAITQLIAESQTWFREKDPKLLGDLTFRNVADFNENGIRICLSALCEIKDESSCSRKLRQNVLELFREHGIALGENRVRLITSDDTKE